MAQCVVTGFVSQDGVEYKRQCTQILTQSGGQGSCGGPAHSPVGMVHLLEYLFLCDFLAVQVVTRRAKRFIKKAIPCSASGHFFLGKYFFLGFAQHVRTIASFSFEEMAIVRQRWITDQLCSTFIWHFDPLEDEEQQLLLDFGAAFGEFLKQRTIFRLICVGCPL